MCIATDIIILQKSFIGNYILYYSTFSFSWPEKERSEIKVIMAIQKDFTNKIIVEYRTDLVNYLYFIFLKIQELDEQLQKPI